MSVILVTGGAGFIGSNVVDRLLKDGNEVVVVDNFNNYYSPLIKEDNIKDFGGCEKFFLHRGDIRDVPFLEEVFQKYHFDSVVHLAGSAGVRPSINDPLAYVDNNIRGTVTLLECMKKYGIKKIVFASSSSVYGNSSEDFFKEDDDVRFPISPYAASKLSCEHFLYTYAHLYGIKGCCLRFFTAYGPRQRPDLAICKFIQKIYHDEAIDVFGDGSTSRDYTYIDDIVQGIVGALNYNDSIYEIVNLGNGRTITLDNMIKTIEQVLAKKSIINYTHMQAGDVNKTCADISKARRLFNYNPQTSFHAGIEKYVRWLKNNNKL